MKTKVWVALDVPTLRDAIPIFEAVSLVENVGIKLGLELITSVGLPAIYRHLPHCPIFIDLKFKDIPNTVGRTVAALGEYSPEIINVHASGGVDMMKAACATKRQSNIYAVTVLTSLDEKACHTSYYRPLPAAVCNFAWMAEEAGCRGIICSAQDLIPLARFANLQKLTPGIRPAWAADKGDQVRVMTPSEAFTAGADGIVIGRPVTKAANVYEALTHVLEEVKQWIS